MILGKLLKAMLALTAGGLVLGSQTSCEDRRPATPALSAPSGTAAVPGAPSGTASEPLRSNAPVTSANGRVIEIAVTEDGYVPAEIHVKKGESVILRVTRKTDETCALDLLIKDTNVKVPLPLLAPVDIPYTPQKAGQIKFGCAMEMMIGGVLLVD